MLLRQALVLVVSFAGGVGLARILSPSQFGLFAIATFLVNLFAVLGDFGVAPSLIQRHEELTEHDLSVAFTMQQLCMSFVFVLLFVGAPFLVGFYRGAPPATIWLVRVLALSLYVTSWRSISVLQLERHLRFRGLAWIEASEVIVYQAAALGLAVIGLGVWALVAAVMVRTLLGAIGLYLLAPYRVRFSWDLRLAKQILRFGIPFQWQSIANQIGGWIGPSLAGVLLGPSAVGFLGWASANGRKPLMAVDSVMRVAFPHFSRVQQDRDQLIQTVVRYLGYLLLFSNLWLAVLLTAGPSLVAWIYTSKWLPGLVALQLFALSLVFDTVGWVAGSGINATGSVGAATRLVTIRTAITVVLSVPLVLTLGLVGIPLANLLASAAIIPRLLARLGEGALKRCFMELAWLAFPLTAGIVSGLAIGASAGGPNGEHAVATSFAVIAAYTAVGYGAAPSWLKKSLRNRSRSLTSGMALPRRAL